ncbi:toll/interleukin-1 receptor domain-containing protein [Maricaulis sp.]|uniref:toll/interleukin-1 receptor domain-containing protein n=1 Tax=Maricaulis sp. TaxID=1486257 RepID=UPI00260E5B83|nr:toll/interleukin-1 receptor domain-containing protein [Maricaulis sp.]MDF1767995.1 toll/interleukin-1 receptor domain-containing protein [Maricaulis sp.]
MSVGTRYRAFISYSHRDQAFARALHRQLETYRVPSRLVGRETALGSVPRRLTPIFRDREDLAATGDLTASVRDALANSGTLIVVCSPDAVASRWVNEEIRAYRQLNPGGTILAAVLAGDPDADPEAEPQLACFPAALLEPGADGVASEPVAADMRREADGRRMALLKLVAGLIGVSLDQLIQRDLQRRQRRVTAITGASVLLSAIMVALTLLALSARSEAERRKAEAEDLIEFMLNDLRDNLEPVGRLDALDAVGAKVIEYYDNQGAATMTSDELGRRARAFHLLGEIDSAQGDLNNAYQHFRIAYESTSRILAVEPSMPERIYEHAQSTYWVGYFAWRRGDLDGAERRFVEYRDLAYQLVDADPDNLEWQTEVAYAHSNIGSLYVGQRRWADALIEARSAVRQFRVLAAGRPDAHAAWTELAQGLAWVASISEITDGRDASIAVLHEQLELYESGRIDSTDDWRLRRNVIAAEYALARLLITPSETTTEDDLDMALAILESAALEASALVAHEPDNLEWRLIAVRQRLWQAQAELYSGDVTGARDAYVAATGFMAHPAWGGAEGARFAVSRLHASLIEGRIFAARGDFEAAQTSVEHMLATLGQVDDWDGALERAPYYYAAGANTLADSLEAQGQTDDAHRIREDIVRRLEPIRERIRTDSAAELAYARESVDRALIRAE